MMHLVGELLGGLGLFFIGVKLIGRNLRQLSGRRIRAAIARIVRGPLRGAMVGIAAGTLTQSTNAVTFILSSMTSAGLLPLSQAMAVVAWANVGTAGLVFVATVDMHVAVMLLLALVGASFYAGVDGSQRWRHVVGALLGVGVLLLGLQSVKSAAGTLRDVAAVADAITAVGGIPVLAFAVGAVLAVLMQSSSTVSAIAVAMTQGGLLTMEQTVVLMYGAGVGSALSLLVLSSNVRGAAKRLVWLQVVVKVAAASILVALLLVEQFLQVPMVLALSEAVSTSLAVQAACVFLLYQVVGASIVTALQRWLPAWLARLAPPSHGDVLSEPKYLYEQALDDAASALDLIDREQERLVARLEGHLRHVEHETILAELPKGTKVHETLGHELEEADERLTERIADALTTLIDEASERALLEALMNRQTRLRVLTDAREALIAFDRASSATREVGEGELRAIAQSMTEALHFVLLALHDVIHDPSAANVEALQEVTGERSTMMDAMRKRWLARLGGRSADQLEVLFEATTTFERVVWLVGRLERLLRDPATPGSTARV